MSELEFTGERVVPGKVDATLWEEHVVRYAFAASWVRGKRVLDFGCGAGYGLDLLRRAAAREVFGCDVAADAVRFARALDASGPGRVLVTDCQAAALRSGSFEVLVSFEVIEHVPDYRAYLREARRLLTGDGLLLLSTPNRRIYTDESPTDKNPFHFKEFYYGELCEALADLFPTVVPFGQSNRGGPFFTRLSGDAEESRVGLLTPPGNAPRHLAEVAERMDYFMVICSPQPELPALRKLPSYFAAGASDELSRLKERFLALQQEFDERTRWALDLNRQVTERGERLKQLQSEFEERTDWALRLEARRVQLEERIAQLEDAVAERDRTVAELRAALETSG